MREDVVPAREKKGYATDLSTTATLGASVPCLTRVNVMNTANDGMDDEDFDSDGIKIKALVADTGNQLEAVRAWLTELPRKRETTYLQLDGKLRDRNTIIRLERAYNRKAEFQGWIIKVKVRADELTFFQQARWQETLDHRADPGRLPAEDSGIVLKKDLLRDRVVYSVSARRKIPLKEENEELIKSLERYVKRISGKDSEKRKRGDLARFLTRSQLDLLRTAGIAKGLLKELWIYHFITSKSWKVSVEVEKKKIAVGVEEWTFPPTEGELDTPFGEDAQPRTLIEVAINVDEESEKRGVKAIKQLVRRMGVEVDEAGDYKTALFMESVPVKEG